RAHHAVLPDREFPLEQRGCRGRDDPRIRYQPVFDAALPDHALALVLPAGQRDRVVGAGPACGAGAGAARGQRAAGGGDAGRLIFITPFGTKGGAKRTRAKREMRSIGGDVIARSEEPSPSIPLPAEGGRKKG